MIVSAPASGQGKTTVTLGLLTALRRRGVQVVSAKSGPDYIDPAFHAAATGAPCINLDSWAMSLQSIQSRAPSGEVLVIEGAMGLLDAAVGAAPGGPGSTQAVAEALELPVILVVDVARMGQSVVAVVDGFNRAGPRPLAGVVLNRLGSARHAEMVRHAVEPVAPVLGLLPRREDLSMPSRHLGLVQAVEHPDLRAFLNRAADWIEEGCDLDRILRTATPVTRSTNLVACCRPLGQRIAVACDEAFAFAYPHMLADWRSQGAEVLPFSPLADEPPPAGADAVFLPGGYPELHAGKLSGAHAFLAGLAYVAGRGGLIYGECGGYMVLGQGLVDAGGQRHAMAGLLPLETSFAERKRHLGYRELGAADGPLEGQYRGHEFHYASTIKADGTPLFQVKDAAGTKLPPTGLISGRVMGSFAHIIEGRSAT
ncbi:MAG: cobyrinate a,c-diamide synthase [Paracoccaceae bacterium]